MNKQVVYTNQFTKDLKRSVKRGCKYSELEFVVGCLVKGKKLSHRYREHKLSGNWVGYLECHIRPDWLLIYKIEIDRIILYRTGSHSDLFKK